MCCDASSWQMSRYLSVVVFVFFMLTQVAEFSRSEPCLNRMLIDLTSRG